MSAMVNAVDIPITVKIRVQPDLDTTLHFCERIARTGVSLLTVHGRTVKENKTAVRAANWDFIKQIVQSVDLPVVANGGVEYSSDVRRMLFETGAAGVMSSEGLLENPALFEDFDNAVDDNVEEDRRGLLLRQLRLAQEYCKIACTHTPSSFGGAGGYNSVKSHVFKMIYRILDNSDFHHLRDRLGCAKGTEDVLAVIDDTRRQIEETSDGGLFSDDFPHLSWYRRHRRLHLMVGHKAHKALADKEVVEETLEERKQRIRARMDDLGRRKPNKQFQFG